MNDAWLRRRPETRAAGIALLALALSTVALFGACSGSKWGGVGETPSSAAQPTAAPRVGGVLHVAMESEPATMDVQSEQDPYTQPLLDAVYSRLLRTVWDTRLGQEQGPQFVPDLAEAWEQPDATTYVFRLRRGVAFHERSPVNGRECTAEDVKYSVERLLKRPATLSSFLADVAAIDAPSSHEVQLRLKRPNVALLAWLASPSAAIVPRELVEQGLVKRVAIGTGPFVMQEVQSGTGATLVKNARYFERDAAGIQKPYLDGVDLPLVKDGASRAAAFRSGRLDVLIGAEQQKGLLEALPGSRLVEYAIPAVATIDLNCTVAPLDDVRVRRAIMYGTNAGEYAALLGVSHARQCGPVGILDEWALPQEELPRYDPERAKQLLAQAGFGEGLSVEARVAEVMQGVSLAPIFKDQMKRIGVDVDVRVMETVPWMVDVFYSRRYQTTVRFRSGYADPDGYLYPFHSQSAENNTGYANAALDELLEKQRQEPDPAERRGYVLEAQHLLLEDAPCVWLHTTSLAALLAPRVQGWRPQPLIPFHPGVFEEIWLND